MYSTKKCFFIKEQFFMNQIWLYTGTRYGPRYKPNLVLSERGIVLYGIDTWYSSIHLLLLRKSGHLLGKSGHEYLLHTCISQKDRIDWSLLVEESSYVLKYQELDLTISLFCLNCLKWNVCFSVKGTM